MKKQFNLKGAKGKNLDDFSGKDEVWTKKQREKVFAASENLLRKVKKTLTENPVEHGDQS